MATRSIWKGAISFGLVNIPVALYPATRREELTFKLLRASDHSPVNYKRVAQADGQEVPWDQIVKGYEYEDGKFVVLKEEDFKRVDVEAAHTVEITDFVDMKSVNPILFYKPYYIEAQKGGDKAYVLLRDALLGTGKIGIAKVVIRTREHVAAVKPQERGLLLELMHFAEEMVDVSEFKPPAVKEVGQRELDMAKQLIASMTSEWQPDKYTDDYKAALEKLIEEKVASPDGTIPPPERKRPTTNVIDLVSVLQQSLEKSSGAKAKGGDQIKAKSGDAPREKEGSTAKAKAPAKAAAARKKEPPLRKTA